MWKSEVIDSSKAALAMVYTGGLWANVSWPQFISVVGGIYTLIVAIEKFAKVYAWIKSKLSKSAPEK